MLSDRGGEKREFGQAKEKGRSYPGRVACLGASEWCCMIQEIDGILARQPRAGVARAYGLGVVWLSRSFDAVGNFVSALSGGDGNAR